MRRRHPTTDDPSRQQSCEHVTNVDHMPTNIHDMNSQCEHALLTGDAAIMSPTLLLPPFNDRFTQQILTTVMMIVSGVYRCQSHHARSVDDIIDYMSDHTGTITGLTGITAGLTDITGIITGMSGHPMIP